jgi:methionyl-tRNA synthetase
MDKKKVLVGMSWPYANGELHIGHIGSSLPADVIARYWRDNGADVSFVSGADCFGTPILVKAREEGKSPEEVANYYADLQAEVYRDLMFSFDNYTRTTAEHHKKFVTEFHEEIYETDKVFVKSVPQLYCDRCKQYLPDRYVVGICPYCGKAAKGDSCDGCGKMLEPEELKSPECKLCGREPKLRETEQIYLRLSEFEKDIEEGIGHDWTRNAIGLTKRYLREGLVDRAITRNISYGIDLPKNAERLLGDIEGKKIYIWAENILGYFAATKEVKADYKRFLCDDRKKKPIHYYIHAKDNIPFHSIILPGLLIANRKHRYHLPDVIAASEYITLNGKKMSKSGGNYITARELLDKYDVDYIRYYFLKTISDRHDADYSEENFIKTINGELIDNFGNLVNRVITFIYNKFEGVIPKGEWKAEKRRILSIHKKIEMGLCGKALTEIMDIVNLGNKYFSESEPWKVLKTQEAEARKIIGNCINMIRTAVKLLSYFIPKSAGKVEEMLGGGIINEKPEILFTKLTRGE